MLKASNNIEQLLKALQVPLGNNIKNSITLEYAVQQIWHRISQRMQDMMQEGTNNDNEQFLRQLTQTTNQAEKEISESSDDVWVFGYGSLVWKADFPYIDRRRGFIKGYQRRFYQQSIDHRGTHVQPGRVVTLIPTGNTEHRVYGVAYRIAAQQKQDVLEHLDYREKNGYERRTLDFHVYPESLNEQFQLIMYIATKDNESYAGHINRIEDIAKQILISAGPSGPNRDYLFNLATAMRALFPDVKDEHLFTLESEVLKLIKSHEAYYLKQALTNHVSNIIDGKELSEDQAEKAASQLLDICCQRGGKETMLQQVVSLDK